MGFKWCKGHSDGTGTLAIPVAQGATVDFIALNWDMYPGEVQHYVEILGEG